MKTKITLVGLAIWLNAIAAGAMETLPVLRVGSETYSNVTVTIISDTDIYFKHRGGLGNAKVKDLDPELQKRFHFDPAAGRAAGTLQVQARSSPGTAGVGTTDSSSEFELPKASDFQVFETEETKEWTAILEQVHGLVAAKDFERLDRLAAHWRQSKERFSNGNWKLDLLYAGCKPAENDSPAVWRQRIAFAEEWSKARPDSITARLVHADLLAGYAWQARGHQYADKVADDAWRLFDVRMQEAQEVIRNAAALKETCPYAGVVQMAVALGTGADKAQFITMANRLIKSEPTYICFYSNPMNFLLPRWYGEEGDSEHFLAEAADRLGGDEGDAAYAGATWRMHNLRAFRNVLSELHLSWQRVNRGFKVMERREPHSLCVLSEHAYLASLAGDIATAQHLLRRLDKKIDLSVWRTRERFDRFVHWCGGED